jgi:hypothetical protein
MSLKHTPKPAAPAPIQEKAAEAQMPVQTAASTAMDISGPVALEAAAPSEDLLKEFTSNLRGGAAVSPMPRPMEFDNEKFPDWKLLKWSNAWALEGRTPGELDAVSKKFGRHTVTIMESTSFAHPSHQTGLFKHCWSYVLSGKHPNDEMAHSGLTPPLATLNEAIEYMEERARRGMLTSGRALPEYEEWSKAIHEAAERSVAEYKAQ